MLKLKLTEEMYADYQHIKEVSKSLSHYCQSSGGHYKLTVQIDGRAHQFTYSEADPHIPALLQTRIDALIQAFRDKHGFTPEIDQ